MCILKHIVHVSWTETEDMWIQSAIHPETCSVVSTDGAGGYFLLLLSERLMLKMQLQAMQSLLKIH